LLEGSSAGCRLPLAPRPRARARRRAPGSRWVSRFEFKVPRTWPIPENFQNPAILQFPHGHKGFRLGRGPGLPGFARLWGPVRVRGPTSGGEPNLVGRFLDQVPRIDRPNPSPARPRSRQAIGWKIPGTRQPRRRGRMGGGFWTTWRHRGLGRDCRLWQQFPALPSNTYGVTS
jgi:hypothetical protein